MNSSASANKPITSSQSLAALTWGAKVSVSTFLVTGIASTTFAGSAVESPTPTGVATAVGFGLLAVASIVFCAVTMLAHDLEEKIPKSD